MYLNPTLTSTRYLVNGAVLGYKESISQGFIFEGFHVYIEVPLRLSKLFLQDNNFSQAAVNIEMNQTLDPTAICVKE